MHFNFKERKYREFGFLLAIVFPLLFGLILPYLTGHSLRLWTFYLVLPFLFLGIFKPILLKLPYDLWIKLGNFLGRINSFIILGMVYITVLIPLSLVMKCFGYDPLRKKRGLTKTFREIKYKHKIDLTKIF
tara:strand:+ start:140 stop:532 length:393 start_codon:yes stop_codon:yes gene_type:complete